MFPNIAICREKCEFFTEDNSSSGKVKPLFCNGSNQQYDDTDGSIDTRIGTIIRATKKIEFNTKFDIPKECPFYLEQAVMQVDDNGKPVTTVVDIYHANSKS